MATVVIPNLPLRFDRTVSDYVPRLDLNPAAKYGELKTVSKGNIRDSQARSNVRRDLNAVIAELDPEDTLILCVGDVLLTALAIYFSIQVHGFARVLRWDNQKREYDIEEVTEL